MAEVLAPDAAEAERLDKLSRQLGVDQGYEFLEAGDLGDAASVRQKLASLASDARQRFVNNVDQHLCTGVVLAVKRGDAELAEVLLDAGTNPNAGDSFGVTALHYAGGRGDERMLELLLRSRADVEKKDDDGSTPLMWAVGAPAVRLLLEAGSDAHAKTREGKTALMICSSRGDDRAIEELVARVPDLDLDAEDRGGRTAHVIAAAAGYPEIGELLVAFGASAPSAPTAAPLMLHVEAFHEAARQGDAGACERLLKAGHVEVDAESCGETALLLASAAGVRGGGAMEVLLRARADPNRADGFLHETPLMRAVLGGCACELVWLLLEARADASLQDVAGRSPADVAAAWGHASGAEILRAAVAGEDMGLGGMD